MALDLLQDKLYEKFEAIESRIMTGSSTDEQRVCLRATLSYGQAVSQALIQRLDATEEALPALESDQPPKLKIDTAYGFG